MPVRHFYLLSHYSCDGLFFLFSVFWLQIENACSAFLLALTLQLRWSILFIFCVLAPEGMDEIVFGERDGIWQYFFFRLFPPNESNSNHLSILSNQKSCRISPFFRRYFIHIIWKKFYSHV